MYYSSILLSCYIGVVPKATEVIELPPGIAQNNPNILSLQLSETNLSRM